MKLLCRPKKWIRVPEEGKNYSVDLDVHVLNELGEVARRYELMCACLDNDVDATDGTDGHLGWLERVERGELQHVAIDGNAWVAHVTPKKVWFESLYGQGEGGEVAHSQFKLALQTYVRFLADPERKPIEVDFPER